MFIRAEGPRSRRYHFRRDAVVRYETPTPTEMPPRNRSKVPGRDRGISAGPTIRFPCRRPSRLVDSRRTDDYTGCAPYWKRVFHRTHCNGPPELRNSTCCYRSGLKSLNQHLGGHSFRPHRSFIRIPHRCDCSNSMSLLFFGQNQERLDLYSLRSGNRGYASGSFAGHSNLGVFNTRASVSSISYDFGGRRGFRNTHLPVDVSSSRTERFAGHSSR